MNDISNLLGERQQTHGSYAEVSAICQSIKRSMRYGSGWEHLSDQQKESLEMMAMKMARILSGNANHPDHWEDIEGYARLVSNELERERVADLMEESMRSMLQGVKDDEQSTATTDSEN